jgi:CHAD domain-containing protein
VSGAELLAPAGAPLAAAAAALAEEVAALEQEVGDGRPLRLRFYDSFDGRLHAAGLLLVHRDEERDGGHLLLLERDSGRQRASLSHPPLAEPTPALALPDGPLREELVRVLDVRALLEVAGVRVRALPLALRDELGRTVARGELLEPVGDGAGAVAPRVRLALAPLRGREGELARLRRRLLELGFAPAPRPLADELVLARGGSPGGVTSKVAVALVPSQRADAAAVAVLRRLAEVMDANREGACAALDAEFLHDFRVALRRTRSVLRQLRGVFPPGEHERFRAEFRWLQQATGPARDLDVYVLEWPAMSALLAERWRAELEPVVAALRRRRELAQRGCAAALRSERALRLRADWAGLLDRLVSLPDADRPAAARPIGELAGRRIARVYRRMVEHGRAIAVDSPASEYHELRKRGKELRYLLELFGRPLYPEEMVGRLVEALKRLQDVLGRHQDREVQVAMLCSLAEELGGQAARPQAAGGQSGGGQRAGDPSAGGQVHASPQALLATGMLIARLCDQELAARAEFAGVFEAFAAKRVRRLVKKTVS